MLKSLFTLTVLLTTFTALAGNSDRGGGDMCENRFKQVRDDIDSWIVRGGPQTGRLQLPSNLSIGDYASAMRAQIAEAKVNCVSDVIRVGETEKTCKKFVDEQNQSQIVCNLDRFLNTGESDQYVLVHHEYAGLANIEVNNGDDSNYNVSNQITAYLEVQSVKKLVVKTVGVEERISNTGAVFTRVYTSPAPGAAFKDPSGLIWEDAVLLGGHIVTVTFQVANRYCNESGARLPTKEELVQLGIYLGVGSVQGYSPKSTTGVDMLTDLGNGRDGYGLFWSSTRIGSIYSYAFWGHTGEVRMEDHYNKFSIRCVRGH
jgi:hypothetical protein